MDTPEKIWTSFWWSDNPVIETEPMLRVPEESYTVYVRADKLAQVEMERDKQAGKAHDYLVALTGAEREVQELRAKLSQLKAERETIKSVMPIIEAVINEYDHQDQDGERLPSLPTGDSAIIALQSIKAALAAHPGEEDGNWLEDLAHENGDSQCRCIHCSKIFQGHKRRVVCKVCASAQPAKEVIYPTADQVWEGMQAMGVTKQDIETMPESSAEPEEHIDTRYGGNDANAAAARQRASAQPEEEWEVDKPKPLDLL